MRGCREINTAGLVLCYIVILDHLGRMHSLGVAHGNIHEGNVMVSGRMVFLIDFQLSRFKEEVSFPWFLKADILGTLCSLRMSMIEARNPSRLGDIVLDLVERNMPSDDRPVSGGSAVRISGQIADACSRGDISPEAREFLGRALKERERE